MKKNLLLAIVLVSILSVKAQGQNLSVERQFPGDTEAAEIYKEAVEKQTNPETTALRTTWVANTPGSNWFVSLEGGLAFLLSENYAQMNLIDHLKPTAGISVGKWFSPVWGLRLNVTGAKLIGYSSGGGTWYVGTNYPDLNGNKTSNSYVFVNTPAAENFIKNRFLDKTYKNGYSYNMTYLGTSIDYLVNLKNLFCVYNSKALFNPVLYAGVGWSHTLKDGNRTAVNLPYGKGGFQFNFRLDRNWDVYLAGESFILPEVFDRSVGGHWGVDVVANVKLGATYHFGYPNFIKAPLGDQIDQKMIDALNAEITALRNRPQIVCPPEKECPPVQPTVKEKEIELTPIFFKLNSFVITDDQSLSIAKVALYLSDNPNAKIEVRAYADKKTGSAAVNLRLSENRANAVVKALLKYGINKNRIKTSFYGDTVQPFSENDKNRVAIFVK